MKRFLTAWERCGVFLIENYIRGVIYICLIFMCNSNGFAQKDSGFTHSEIINTDSIKPLWIGDSIPPQLWNMPLEIYKHGIGKQIIKLADFKDKKVIILDFWSTSCKPCIESINHYQKLLNDASFEEVVLIPVLVYDRPERLPAFFERTEMNFFTIINTTILNLNYFKNYLTGYGVVWIANGRLVAIPIPNDQTKENLKIAASGIIPNIPFRKGYPLK